MVFLLCLEFCWRIKNKNKTKQHIEALAIEITMPLSFVWFCCSVAQTKPYKKYYKKDHVALYQYVNCGPGSQKTKCRSGPGNTRSCEIWKNGTIYSSIILTFHQPRVLLLFSSIYEFKFTSFLILAISKPGDSYKLLQRQKIQARGNKTIAGTKTNKNNAV